MRSHARYPDEVESIDFHWLAGLLEGEGTFMAGPPSSPGLPILAVAMVDRDVIDRAGSLMGAKTVTVRARKRAWKISYLVSLRGFAGRRVDARPASQVGATSTGPDKPRDPGLHPITESAVT